MTSPVWDHIQRGQSPTPDLVASVAASRALVLGQDGVVAETAQLAAAVLGAGPLQPLVEDPDVTDILVNGTRGVWVDRGDGVVRVPCPVGVASDVRRLAVRLAGLAGRRLDDTSPYVDGLLPGGVRLHAVLPPLVEDAAHISLRVPRRAAPTVADLQGWKAFPPLWAGLLRALVTARVSFVISGGTGTGKTTLLAALLAAAGPGERLVIVEDTRELAVDHPHVVRLTARPANVEGRGEVGLVTLTRQALRMRPDRLVVGEVRGAEVREMLAALNTGHEGGCSTVHANDSADVVSRFEALGALAGMTPAATRTQLSSAVSAVVHLRRHRGRRIVASLGVLVSVDGDRLEVLPALTHPDLVSPGSDKPSGGVPGPGWGRLVGLLGVGDTDLP